MGLFSCIFVLIPIVLILAFVTGRNYRDRLVIRTRGIFIAWILAVLLVLGVLFLPSFRWIDTIVSPFPKPFDSIYAGIIYLFPLLALILATFLLFIGLTLIKLQGPSGVENGTVRNPSIQHNIWNALASLILSDLLYGSSLYNLYWQSIWDSTTDSMNIILLIGPLIAVLVSGALLSGILRGWNRLYSLLYTAFLAGVVILVYTFAKRTDYHQLTVTHAATVTRAVDTYYAREGRYPQSLGQLVPWTVLWLPKPVIMHGQDWCYQSGEAFYRLGYVWRDQWSSPYLSVRVYKSEGTVPDLPALCQAETDAIIARESIYSVID
jgi:hypothetical protein